FSSPTTAAAAAGGSFALLDGLPISCGSGASADAGRAVCGGGCHGAPSSGVCGVCRTVRGRTGGGRGGRGDWCTPHTPDEGAPWQDRKSTRLNSSHVSISYAVFCLNK